MESRWYGWQTLTTDGVAIGLVLVGASAESTAVALGGAALYGLGAPVIHEKHGQPGKAFASLGLRVTLPLALGYVSYEAQGGNHCGRELCELATFGEGFLVGIGVAILIDAAVLARQDVPRASGEVSLLPTLTLKRDSGAVGVIGAF